VSGHSKWATIKHKKAATDKARAKTWMKAIRNIEIAAREGGGDLSSNATLRTMVSKAKSEQVPSDKIDNAIKRATGELKAEIQDSITYEGYAPSGVAVLVEVLTDNRNRAASDVRAAFSKNGGSIAEPGAVAWQFERQGVILVPKTSKGSAKALDEDTVMMAALEAGAEDVADIGDAFEVRCRPTNVGKVCTGLAEAGIGFDSAERPMVAKNLIELSDEADARKVLKLIEVLEELDDVDEVYANFDLPESVMALLG
jgi:YebC/PmpR family DNA-binding regulatory protein